MHRVLPILLIIAPIVGFFPDVNEYNTGHLGGPSLIAYKLAILPWYYKILSILGGFVWIGALANKMENR